MDIKIINPTYAVITKFDEKEITTLQKALSYTNTSISFQLGKLYKNQWFKTKNPVAWERQVKELKEKQTDCLIKMDKNSDYYLRPGIIPYISDYIDNIENNIKYPDLKEYKWKNKPEYTPYPYQSESVEKLIKEKHGNVSLPTGCGKTLLTLLLTQKMGLNTVLVTPSQSIFNEILTEFQHRLGDKLVGGYGDGKKDIKKPITIAIGKSLTMLKPNTEAYNFFKNKQVVIVDESHVFGAEQLNDVCHEVLSDIPYRFFLSATQTRGDGTEKLLNSIIGKNVYEMDIATAINNKYLCPLKFNIIKMNSFSNKKITDPNECKRIHLLRNPLVLQQAAKIANACWELKQESTLILVEELEQIEILQQYLKVPFAYVHSADKKKSLEFNLERVDLQESVDKFNRGEVRVLIGTRAISTGTNLFPTHNVINLVGGGSEIATKQGTMGRATRKLELSKYKDLHKPKPYSQIYDFDISGQPILKKQLDKRIEFYQESGGDVKFF